MTTEADQRHLVERLNEAAPGPQARIDYVLRRVAGQAMLRLPFAQRALRKAAYLLEHVALQGDIERDTTGYLRKLRGGEARDRATDPTSGFGYDSEAQELLVAVNYSREAARPDFARVRTESHALYEDIEATVARVLEQDPAVRSFVDFGVGYAHVEARLARRFPQVEFIGIDRSRLTQRFNEHHFADLPNTRFVSGDIFDLLRERRFDGGVFFHARTLLMLPPETIDRLYDAVRGAGFRWIVGFEQAGISRETHGWYRFSADEDRPSVVFRGFMFIHNYPYRLRRSGFTLVDADVIRTRHPNPDFRVLRLVARRAEDRP